VVVGLATDRRKNEPGRRVQIQQLGFGNRQVGRTGADASVAVDILPRGWRCVSTAMRGINNGGRMGGQRVAGRLARPWKLEVAPTQRVKRPLLSERINRDDFAVVVVYRSWTMQTDAWMVTVPS
jgi:hypothetical protein